MCDASYTASLGKDNLLWWLTQSISVMPLCCSQNFFLGLNVFLSAFGGHGMSLCVSNLASPVASHCCDGRCPA